MLFGGPKTLKRTTSFTGGDGTADRICHAAAAYLGRSGSSGLENAAGFRALALHKFRVFRFREFRIYGLTV